MELLRLITAGSVDDGKSTLIGRLFLDSRAILDDQWAAVQAASQSRGDEQLDLALFTDGLQAEREQRITIDVAYRHFRTPRRRFLIADCPGHLQYTRNMVTGASTAELALVLLDARKGVLTQTRRHAFLTALLHIPHLVLVVNKLDLVDYSQTVYDSIVADFRQFASRLELQNLTFIPVSALHGDNLLEPSPRTPWYRGSTLLHHLETVNLGTARNIVDFRFPVQTVLRPHQNFRGFAGRVASGRIAVGEEIAVLPSGVRSRILSIHVAERDVPEAHVGDSVVFTLRDEVDVSRGDMLVRHANQPTCGQQLDTMLCWCSETPLNPQQSYLLQHTTRRVPVRLASLDYRIDVDTMHRERVATLGLNDVGRAQLLTAQPLHFDTYRLNRETGSFILIDPTTNDTVAAGFLRGPSGPSSSPAPARAAHLTPTTSLVTREEREAQNGHRAAVLWFTGLSGSGKSSVARRLERRLFERRCQVTSYDGDNLRTGLCSDLGFKDADRTENIRRAGELARLAFEQGQLVLCSFISPFRRDRDLARSLVEKGRFLEIFVYCPLEVCRQRDPKGLYRRAESGEIPNFTGVSSPYEAPSAPELLLDSSTLDVDSAVDLVIELLERRGLLVPGHQVEP